MPNNGRAAPRHLGLSTATRLELSTIEPTNHEGCDAVETAAAAHGQPVQHGECVGAAPPRQYGAELHNDIIHDLSGEIGIYLAADRTTLDRRVAAYANQTYVVTLRFAAPKSGWSFEETIAAHTPLAEASPGFLAASRRTFERPSLLFRANDTLAVTVTRADWLGVTLGDWRALHGVVTSLRMCGVPQNPACHEGAGCGRGDV